MGKTLISQSQQDTLLLSPDISVGSGGARPPCWADERKNRAPLYPVRLPSLGIPQLARLPLEKRVSGDIGSSSMNGSLLSGVRTCRPCALINICPE